MQREKTKEIQQLIDLGKEKGYLTYEEVNDVLPEEITNADQIDDVLSMFDELDIEIVDNEDDAKSAKKKTGTAKGPETPSAQPKEEEEAEEEEEEEVPADAYTKTTDPVRMYLRKLGSVRLLTREGEVELAKRIEQHADAVLNILHASAIGLKEALNLGDSLKKSKIRVTEIVKDLEDLSQEEEFDETEHRNRVLKQFGKFKQLSGAHGKIVRKVSHLNEGKTLEKQKALLLESQGSMVRCIKEMRFNRKTINSITEKFREIVDLIEAEERLMRDHARK